LYVMSIGLPSGTLSCESVTDGVATAGVESVFLPQAEASTPRPATDATIAVVMRDVMRMCECGRILEQLSHLTQSVSLVRLCRFAASA
jgi:hypothetical protein